MLTDQELSALVAELVYRYHVLREDRTRMALAVNSKGTAAGMGTRPVPPFAIDQGLALDAALKALEGRELTITEHVDSWFEASYRHVDPEGYPGSSGWVSSCGPTLARALCLASLRAVGVEVEDDGEEGT